MAFITPQARFEGVEEYPAQNPFKALLGVLIAGEMTETQQNMGNSDSAGVNFGLMPSPQAYRNASAFNTVSPVIPASAPALPARTRRNSIMDL